MVEDPQYRHRSRLGLLCGASAAAIISLTVPGIASAHATGEPAAEESGSRTLDTSEIVVTGTRVIRDGYEAPTPTSVIGAAEIAAKAPANIADFVNQLPALSGATTPTSTKSYIGTGVFGVNALNLRNLGPVRTLVLLDGQRVGASSVSGLVDINQFPQTLVKRVDIVTGGASAGYGSDAVAGVVNFVLDKEFTGLKGQVQGGVTNYGDNRNYQVSLTAGARFAEDRGHILLNGEINHEDGITGFGKRTWYNGKKIITNPAYAVGNGLPQLIVRDQVGFATATPGGIITSGPLRGTYFGPGGVPAQFNYGSLVSGNFFIGDDWRYADYAASGDIAPEQNRQSGFGRLSYDLTDHVNVFVQASYARATARERVTNQFQLGNLTIRSDNAFLPESVAAQMAAQGLTSVTVGTFNEDLGSGIAYNKRSSWRAALGGSGDFDAFGSNWSWDVYGQRSVNHVYTSYLTTVTARYRDAIDAVRNANGAIVCRSTLANPTNGCVPYNVLGTGVASAAAINYVQGLQWANGKLTEDVVAATLRGEPFATWAGPVSIATGVEHRREAVTGTNDPLSSTGSAYFTGRYLATFGSYHINEAFLETVIPLSNGAPLAERLDLNAAVRATDYSTSGFVTTWKAGLTYSPVDDITFRVTRSRDIRAPNLGELFQAGASSNTTFTDPFQGNAQRTVVATIQGNRNLKPEKANSLGLGVVLQPSFLPGFAASVDYFDIRIKDAVTTLTTATIVNQCFAGNAAVCPSIVRDASGNISTVLIQPINLAKQINRGIDFEASYRHPLLGGNLSLRLLATRYLKNYSSNGINVPTDTVGTNGANLGVASLSSSGSTALPKWRYLGSIGWDRDPVALTFTARGFSAGVYNTSYVQCTSGCPVSTVDNQTIDNNQLPGAIYFDANIRVKLLDGIESYLSVDNIANKDPVQVAYGPSLGAAPIPLNQSLYDTFGRTFRVGVRFKM